MPDIQMPDGTLMRNVPEGTPPDVIMKAYQALKQPSVMDNAQVPPATDVAKGALSGAAEGGIGATVGAPSDLSGLASKGLEKVLGLFGPSAGIEKAIDQSSVGQTANKAMDAVGTQALAKDIGADYAPYTPTGKAAKGLAAGASSFAAGPMEGMLARTLLGGGIGGLDTAANGVAGGGNVAGDLMGTGVAGALSAFAAHKPRIVSATQDLINDVGVPKLQEARDSADAASRQLNGKPVLLTQGIPNQTGMSALTDLVLQHPEAGAPGRAALEAQVPEAQDRISNLIKIISQRATNQDTANSVQASGSAALAAPGKAVSALAQPSYTAAKNDFVTPDQVMDLATKVRGIPVDRAMQSTKGGSAINGIADRLESLIDAYPNGVPVTELDNLAKESGSLSKPSATATGAAKAKAAGYALATAAITDFTTGASPALKDAKDLFSAGQEAFVEPVKKSALTSMFPPATVKNGKGNWDAMTSILGDRGSDRSADIMDAARRLDMADAAAKQPQLSFPTIVGKWMTDAQGKANTLVEGRPAPNAINTFVDTVAGAPGTPQRNNFSATMHGVANSVGADPQAVVDGTNKLMDALQVISRDRRSIGAIDTSTVAGQAGGGDLTSGMGTYSPIQPFRAMRTILSQRLQASTYKRIADALTSPEGVAKLQEISQWNSLDRVKGVAENMLRGNGLVEGQD